MIYEASGLPLLKVATIGLPSLVATASALFAFIQARHARLAERDLEKLRRLEARVSGRKYDVYKPMIEMFDKQLAGVVVPDSKELSAEFLRWIVVFGSDEAIIAYGHFMQCTYASAPPDILPRMYAEFILAVRRDLGDAESKISALDFYAPKLNDLFDIRSTYFTLARPLEEVLALSGWQAPWLKSPEDMIERPGSDQ
jgi:hypothetical protein